ncbi:MAG: O-antigen ligase family protein [Solirubrobacterales bacterium]
MHPDFRVAAGPGLIPRSLLAVTAAWTALVLGVTAGLVPVAGMPVMIAFVALPLSAWGLLLRADPPPGIGWIAAWTALVLGAILVVPFLVSSPAVALAPLALILSAAICTRLPATAVMVVFTISAIYGSLNAFTGTTGGVAVDLVLAGAWFGLLVPQLAPDRQRPHLTWPGIVIVGLYLAITLLGILLSANPSVGFVVFRLSAWYLMALLLLAYAGWPAETYSRIARGIVLVAGLVGAYAAFRWVAGPAHEELLHALGNPFNFIDGEMRVIGSLPSGHELGFWAGSLAPLSLAALLGWRGGWRLVAGGSYALLAFAVLVSEARGPFVGLVLGSGVVLGLYQVAGSMPRIRVGIGVLITAACIASLTGALIYSTNGEDSAIERYSNILEPSEDGAFARREQKWGEAIDEIDTHPFGHGLGAASLIESLRPYESIGGAGLDNAYLKLAYEQGFPVVILFITGFLLLLVRLGFGAMRSRSRDTATAAMGSAGVLTSCLLILYTGVYIEALVAVGVWIAVGLGVAVVLREESAAVGALGPRPVPEPSRRPVPRLAPPVQQPG